MANKTGKSRVTDKKPATGDEGESILEAVMGKNAVNTFDGMMAAKKRQTTEFSLCMDGSLAEAQAVLDIEWKQAENRGTDPDSPEMVDLAEKLAEATAAADEMTVDFKFQALGGDELDELLNKWPPTGEQQEAHREERRNNPGSNLAANLLYNAVEFEPELVSMCCVQPAMTPEQVKTLFKSGEWNQTERDAVLNAALNVCRIVR